MNQADLEEKVLNFWRKNKVFAATTKKDALEGDFVFYEGPPTANGHPGIHHVLARSFKDLISRYKTMRGFRVARKAGWDTHGLPVELGVEKKLGISGKKQIESLRQTPFESIKYFNEECRKSVWQYKKEWEELTERMGFWIDMDNPYITYEPEYIESLWWVIRQIWDKGLLYQDYKVLPYCPRCGTALSSHEVAQGYKDVEDTSVYVKFKLKNMEDGKWKMENGRPVYFLSWTTTPWTLPGNVALAVGEDIDYAIIKSGKEYHILAREIFERWQKIDKLKIEKVDEIKGKDLVGLEYEQLFPGAIPKTTDGYKNAFKVYPADFVNTEEGTGIVHTAVMYGEDDYNLGQEIGLPKVHSVSEEGKFSFKKAKEKVLQELEGKFVFKKEGEQITEAEKIILKYLRDKGNVFAKEKYGHSYPHCWRCDTPLLYYAKSSWFIAVSKLRGKLIENNEQINWQPEYIKHGRFGNWLEEAKDWAFSRERYWGTPLPIWVCAECNHRICVGSFKELKQMTNGRKVEKGVKQEIDRKSSVALAKDDPHRPFIDEIKFDCPQCKKGQMSRVAEVVDVWFDSGAMPYAQYHYMGVPLPPRLRGAPASQAGEGGLPYPADYICEAIDQTRGWFYTLLAIATLLGKKAPYKNVISLGHILDKRGKKMSKSKGNIIEPKMIFDKYGVDVLRWYLYTINNPGEPKNFDEQDLLKVQRRLFMTLQNLFNFYGTYRSKKLNLVSEPAGRQILDKWILSSLSRLVKQATKSLDNYDIATAARDIEKFINDDVSTWYLRRSRPRFKSDNNEEALAVFGYVLTAVVKLLAPFTPFTSEHWWQELGNKESVHLSDWPKSSRVNEKLMADMDNIRRLAELIHALRAQAGIKVRQPLAEVRIKDKLSDELRQILAEEVNVINVKCQMSNVKCSPGWLISNDGSVALNTKITPELREQGLLRELIRQINSLRKKQGLTPGDRVRIMYQTDSKALKSVFDKYDKDLKKSVIADDIKYGKIEGEKVKINNELIAVALARERE